MHVSAYTLCTVALLKDNRQQGEMQEGILSRNDWSGRCLICGLAAGGNNWVTQRENAGTSIPLSLWRPSPLKIPGGSKLACAALSRRAIAGHARRPYVL